MTANLRKTSITTRATQPNAYDLTQIVLFALFLGSTIATLIYYSFESVVTTDSNIAGNSPTPVSAIPDYHFSTRQVAGPASEHMFPFSSTARWVTDDEVVVPHTQNSITQRLLRLILAPNDDKALCSLRKSKAHAVDKFTFASAMARFAKSHFKHPITFVHENATGIKAVYHYEDNMGLYAKKMVTFTHAHDLGCTKSGRTTTETSVVETFLIGARECVKKSAGTVFSFTVQQGCTISSFEVDSMAM